MRREIVFNWLMAQYAGPGRFYHTAAHIERMFRQWHEVSGAVSVSEPYSLSLAIWFHDCVYDPRRYDNEERSADEAGSRLAPRCVSDAVPERVGRMIRAAATHEAAEDWDAALLLDLDLEILSATAGDYDAYAGAVHREYGFVPDADFRAGRLRVLRRFLERPRIYATGPLFAEHEQAARGNLAREIAALLSLPRAIVRCPQFEPVNR